MKYALYYNALEFDQTNLLIDQTLMDDLLEEAIDLAIRSD